MKIILSMPIEIFIRFFCVGICPQNRESLSFGWPGSKSLYSYIVSLEEKFFSLIVVNLMDGFFIC